MSTVQDVSAAPAVAAVPKKAMALGPLASLIILALLIVTPLFVKNFIIFQMTMWLIYAIAVLALNILTGASGQFSLGQSAFYALGAYTSAILMEHVGVNYALTLPSPAWSASSPASCSACRRFGSPASTSRWRPSPSRWRCRSS
jgi:branched-chain amino acid transport system permease protein